MTTGQAGPAKSLVRSDATAGTDGHRHLLLGAAQNGLIGIAGSAVAAAAGLALNVVVGRYFGAAASGMFFVVVAVIMVASTVSRLGADTGMVWALPRARELGRGGEARRTALTAMVPVTLASVALGLCIYLLAGGIAHVVVAPQLERETADLLRVAAPFIVLTAPVLVLTAGIRGAGRLVAYTTIQNGLLAGSRPLLVLWTTAAGLGLTAALWAWGAPLIVALALAGAMLLRATRPVASPQLPRPTREVAREFWRFSAPRSMSAVLEVAIVWADVLIVSALTGSRQAGIYAAASRFITTGTLFESAMRVALASALSARLAVADLLGAARLHLASTQWIILLSWPLYIALACYAPAVLAVFGPDFVAGADALTLLCVAMLIAMAAGNSQTVLLMSGRSAWQLGNKLVAIVLNLGLNFYLVPRYGMVGAAWAWAVTIFVDSSVVVLQVRYLVGVRIGVRAVLRAATVGATAFGVIGISVRAATDLTLSTVVIAIAVSCLLHAAVLWHQRTHFNVDILRQSIRRGRGAT